MVDSDNSYPGFSVPPLGYQERFWKPSNPQIFTNAVVQRQTGPYLSALPARIADWSPQPEALKIPGLEEALQRQP